MIGDLELIAKATDPLFWLNRIEQTSPLTKDPMLLRPLQYLNWFDIR